MNKWRINIAYRVLTGEMKDVCRYYLRWSSLMRTIMFKWPWEYCSITSRTSYGLRACCKKKHSSCRGVNFIQKWGKVGTFFPSVLSCCARSSVELSSIACYRCSISQTLSTFRCRLESHLLSLSYPNFWFHLFNAPRPRILDTGLIVVTFYEYTPLPPLPFLSSPPLSSYQKIPWLNHGWTVLLVMVILPHG